MRLHYVVLAQLTNLEMYLLLCYSRSSYLVNPPKVNIRLKVNQTSITVVFMKWRTNLVNKLIVNYFSECRTGQTGSNCPLTDKICLIKQRDTRFSEQTMKKINTRWVRTIPVRGNAPMLVSRGLQISKRCKPGEQRNDSSGFDWVVFSKFDMKKRLSKATVSLWFKEVEVDNMLRSKGHFRRNDPFAPNAKSFQGSCLAANTQHLMMNCLLFSG